MKRRAQAKQPELLQYLPPEVRQMIAQDTPVKSILAWCATSKEHSELCDDQYLWKALLWRDFGEVLEAIGPEKDLFGGEYNPLGNDKLKYKTIALLNSELLKARWYFRRVESNKNLNLRKAAKHIKGAYLVKDLFHSRSDAERYFWAVYGLVDPFVPDTMLSMPKSERLSKKDYSGMIWKEALYKLVVQKRLDLLREFLKMDSEKLGLTTKVVVNAVLIRLIYVNRELVWSRYWKDVVEFLAYLLPRQLILDSLKHGEYDITKEIETAASEERRSFLEHTRETLLDMIDAFSGM